MQKFLFVLNAAVLYVVAVVLILVIAFGIYVVPVILVAVGLRWLYRAVIDAAEREDRQ